MLDFIKGLWPRSLFTWLGLVLSAMSVLALIQHGFNYGFGPTFTLLLAYYENLFQQLIGWWAEPIINAWLSELCAYIGWGDLHLYPHWKHVFVLSWLYLGTAARNTLASGDVVGAAFRAVWGAVVSSMAAVGAGVVPTGSGFEALLIPLAATTGMFAYGVGHSFWSAAFARAATESLSSHFALYMGYYVRRTTAAVLTIAAAIVAAGLPYIRDVPNLGVAILFVLIVAFALYWVWLGLRTARKREAGVTWGEAIGNNGAFRLGTWMLGGMFLALAFVAANAGLRFYGL